MTIFGFRAGVEPIMFYLTLLLLLCIGCLVSMVVFNHVMNQRLRSFAELQERHRTISDVSLIISKNVSRLQVGYQHMLLASSEGDLENAESTIRESIETVRRASLFLERGGVFVEDFKVNFDALDNVVHEFRLDATVPGLDVASMEFRTSLALLERMLGEYHEFAVSALSRPGMGGRSTELVLMHKRLAPFFSRTTEHANRFYVQSMKNLAAVQADLRRAEEFYGRTLNLVLAASIVAQILIGLVVLRSAAKVLDERADARQKLLASNERLEERVLARTEELAASEGRLRDIALTSGDIIWQTDSEGRFIYIAGQSERLLGVGAEEAIGLTLADFVAESGEGRKSMARAMGFRTAAKPIVDLVLPLVSRRDGRVRHFLVNAIPIGSGFGAGGYFGVAKDVTEKMESEVKLRLYEKVFETAQEGITITGPDGSILVVNPAFTAITGYSAQEAIGQNPRILKSEHHPDEFYQAMWRSLTNEGLWTGELWNRRKSGEAYPEWLSITAVRDEHGAVSHYIAVFHDITAMKEKEAEILRMAYYDPLTGLPNRAMLQEKFGVALFRAEKESVCYAVVYVDLDNFKLVNDSLGHDAGDELLVEVGRRFQRLVRSEDVVARLGGDEFVFLFAHPGERCVDSHVYSERIQKALAAPVRVKGQEIFVTPSIGIARYPEDGVTIQALLKHADLAMYSAKSMGKNQFRLFDEEMTARASARLSLENRLRMALGHQEIFPLFQPKVDLCTGQVIGAEALARWVVDDGTVVSPMDFIPIAEETGLIVPLGKSILEQSCRAIRTVAAQTGKALGIAVNVSARQFRHEGFVDDIRSIVRDAGISFESLELEITESLLLGDIGVVGDKLRVLSGLGLSVSIDDFGTGYSSLSYLSQLPIDRIKIDRSFVLRLPGESSDVELLQAIIQMGKSLRMRVLAEGVETAEHARTLAQMGCDEAQGYFYGKPMPLHELIMAVKKSARA